MAKKIRLDVHLTEEEYFPSRNKAKGAIMAGIVFVNGERIDKAGTKIDPESEIEIKGEHCPYVSRGGYKLEKAIEAFNLDLTDYKMLDVGASTGGFTDCALQNGACQVYALDVGYGQLAWKLRQDSRVEVIERTNIRYLTKDDLPEVFDIVTIDVSFISLSIVIPASRRFLKHEGEMVALIKPQFEAGRDKVGKNGVVKDPEIHKEVIEKVIGLVNETDLQVVDLSYSPITGASGHNIEFLIYLKDGLKDEGYSESKIDKVISEAHADLKA